MSTNEAKITLSLAEQIAALVEGHDPTTVFDACTAVLAANDVFNGSPDWTIVYGRDKVKQDIYYLSAVARETMHMTNRMPTISELISTRAMEAQGKLRAFRIRCVN